MKSKEEMFSTKDVGEALKHLQTTSGITKKGFDMRYNPSTNTYRLNYMGHKFMGMGLEGLYDACVDAMSIAEKVTDNFENIK